MSDYPHLRLPYKIEGLAKPAGSGGPSQMQQTLDNRANRNQHGTKLLRELDNLRNTWNEFRQYKAQGQSALPNDEAIPIFLRIDPNTFQDLESFRHWGVQIISEEEDGLLLGVAQSGFDAFEHNLAQFLQETGTYKNTAAKIWEIADNTARINRLLKGDLKSVWGAIDDQREYTIEIGVYCSVPNLLKFPDRQDFDNQATYDTALELYREDEKNLFLQRDQLQREREMEVSVYINAYNGIQYDEWNNETDALYFKLSLPGSGLRDLVITYQYLFKVSFPAVYQIDESVSNLTALQDVEIIAPHNLSPAVCIIDSGIQQNHNLLAPAINPIESISYVRNDTSVADHVRRTGHGTKVAGAVLFPRTIPTGTVQLPLRLQNARILNADNEISNEEFGPALMVKIVTRFANTRIFNLSVTERTPYDGSHMHELAESIDKLIHERNILFIIPAGNIREASGSVITPGINEFIQSGIEYPFFLNEPQCRIANPGTSFFALTVGSIGYTDFEDENVTAVAGQDHISPFSRTGLGMWESIKPDVVEYGGDLVRNKISSLIGPNSNTSVELVNSTLFGGAAHGKEFYGTSFSAPKVSHIIAMLQMEHPEETAQMYRALVVQSARLPQHCFNSPSTLDFARYGYGIPNLDRALNNSNNRITFIQQGRLSAKKADIYMLSIPEELRGESVGFQLMVEVTLAFTAKTRATRKGSHSYLSTWLEWKSSRYNENFHSFRSRTLEYLDEGQQENVDIEEGDKAIKWVVRENPIFNRNVNINRNNSSIQKSWAIIHPHQFTDDFSLAIIGHSGWDKNLENFINYALVISFEAVGAELPIYRLFSEAQLPEQETNEAEV